MKPKKIHSVRLTPNFFVFFSFCWLHPYSRQVSMRQEQVFSGFFLFPYNAFHSSDFPIIATSILSHYNQPYACVLGFGQADYFKIYMTNFYSENSLYSFSCRQYAAEVLPTVVRAQGVALIHIMGYVATILSPFVVYLVSV